MEKSRRHSLLNHKYSTWLLLLMVVILWGIILYRLIEFTGAPNQTSPKAVGLPENQAIQSPIINDTFQLNLRYNDPFLKKAIRNKKTQIKTTDQNQSLSANSKEPQKRELEWPEFKYFGQINSNKGTTVFLIASNKQKKLVKAGDTIEGQIVLKEGWPDSIKLQFKGKSKFIRKVNQ